MGDMALVLMRISPDHPIALRSEICIGYRGWVGGGVGQGQWERSDRRVPPVDPTEVEADMTGKKRDEAELVATTVRWPRRPTATALRRRDLAQGHTSQAHPQDAAELPGSEPTRDDAEG